MTLNFKNDILPIDFGIDLSHQALAEAYLQVIRYGAHTLRIYILYVRLARARKGNTVSSCASEVIPFNNL